MRKVNVSGQLPRIILRRRKIKILFHDVIQYCDVPASLKSPALSDTTEIYDGSMTIDMPNHQGARLSAFGIGNTNGSFFNISFLHNNNENPPYTFNIIFDGNGLYTMPCPAWGQVLRVATDATFIGRFAAGIGVNIPTAIAKQPGWCSTSEPRTTLSGQIIPGAGGYNYRTLSLDSRYKLGREALSEIEAGYKYAGIGYPFFIGLADESYKLPYSKLYATEQNQRQMSFEGGITKFLYSRRWEFREAF